MIVLTPKEAAEFLGIKPSTLQKYQREGQFEGLFYRVGKRVLYIQEKLQSWAEAGGTNQDKVNNEKYMVINGRRVNFK